jgi:hypothetical protein
VQSSDRAHITRILRYVIGIIAVELGLFIIARVAPALATLIRPAYWVVAALFVVPVWHATRRRAPGHDRRHADRRHDV